MEYKQHIEKKQKSPIIPSQITIEQLNTYYNNVWHDVYHDGSQKVSDLFVSDISIQLERMQSLRIPPPSDFHVFSTEQLECVLFFWEFKDFSYVIQTSTDKKYKTVYEYYVVDETMLNFLKGLIKLSTPVFDRLTKEIQKLKINTTLLDVVLSIIKNDLHSFSVYVIDDDTLSN